nr:SDR family NAD(P)-dependent oxidoreductase [Bacteroidota bacterium]
MNYFFISGTSKGIGKALCQKILEDPKNKVVGISRSFGFEHPNFTHIQFNLAESGKIAALAEELFKMEEVPQKVVLINNAGILGEVGPFGSVSDESLIELYNVNVIAPAILMNIFINKFKGSPAEKIVINISSGAGSRAMDGWGGYCSSKAAINMMSEVAALESNIAENGFKIFSLAPGVVDTD